MFFAGLLKRLIVAGELSYIDHRQRVFHCGSGPLAGIAPVTLRLTDGALDWRLGTRPLLAVGEAYMDGKLLIEAGSLFDFLALAAYNITHEHRARGVKWSHSIDFLWRRLQQYNPVKQAERNVAHHYDLSPLLYDLFLDADRQYSCAYFAEPGMSLEAAQLAKKRHIMAKLALRPGDHVLDIGCGWGGMALTLAGEANVEVTGITLSQEQLIAAKKRAADLGESRVQFRLIDYREMEGPFDRIVSVGMFEHVGVTHYDAFFAKIAELLRDDGVALIHFICRPEGPGTTNSWFRKYIFPGGYSPALSEVLPSVERSGLFVTDLEIWRLHYAETIKEWRKRFEANRRLAAERYDERFCRMWEFYLTGSEIAFRFQGHMVAQLQLAKNQTALPLTRDYMLRP